MLWYFLNAKVGLPMHMAKILTYPEKVTTINYDRMRQLVLNGREVYPGATSVTKGETKIKLVSIFEDMTFHQN